MPKSKDLPLEKNKWTDIFSHFLFQFHSILRCWYQLGFLSCFFMVGEVACHEQVRRQCGLTTCSHIITVWGEQISDVLVIFFFTVFRKCKIILRFWLMQLKIPLKCYSLKFHKYLVIFSPEFTSMSVCVYVLCVVTTL